MRKFPRASLLCQIWEKSDRELTSIQYRCKNLNRTDEKQLKSKNQIKSNNKKQKQKQKQKHKKRKKKKKQ